MNTHLKHSKLAHEARAISPLIATIILIAITVAGGALVYTIFFNTANTINDNSQLQIKSINLVQPTTGNAVFSMVVQNVGNTPITSLSFTVNGTIIPATNISPTLSSTTPLQPGQTATVTYTFSNPAIIGNTYSAVVSGTTSGGAFSQTTSVECTTA